jgi:hypothetical protein
VTPKNRVLSLIATTAALALAAASPAAAQSGECEGTCVQPPNPTVLTTGGTTVSRTTLGPVFSVTSTTVDQLRNKTISQSASGEIIEDNGATQTVAIECSATAGPNALVTSVTQCYLFGKNKKQRVNAPVHGAVPGSTDATAEIVVEVEYDRWKVCVQSNTFFQDNTYLEAPVVCS